MSSAPPAACAARTSAARCWRRDLRVDRRPVVVAVGRFANDIVQAGRRLRIGLQQLGVGAEIAGGEHPQRLAGRAFAGEFDFDRGRAEQMSGVPVARAHARHDLNPSLVIDRAESIERGDSIALRVDRRHERTPARRIAPVERGDFRFLDAAGVGQHVGAQVDGAARRQDRAAKAAAHQLRYQAAVVDMRVRQSSTASISAGANGKSP